MCNIYYEIEEEVEDVWYILKNVVQSIIIDAADKIIKEIKRIDSIDINIDNDNWNEYVDYVLKNIVDYDGSLKDNKYNSIDTILNAQAAEEIKNDKIVSLINNELDEVADESTETFKITAKVFFSDLDQ